MTWRRVTTCGPSGCPAPCRSALRAARGRARQRGGARALPQRLSVTAGEGGTATRRRVVAPAAVVVLDTAATCWPERTHGRGSPCRGRRRDDRAGTFRLPALAVSTPAPTGGRPRRPAVPGGGAEQTATTNETARNVPEAASAAPGDRLQRDRGRARGAGHHQRGDKHLSAAGELSRMSTELQELVGRFRCDPRGGVARSPAVRPQGPLPGRSTRTSSERGPYPGCVPPLEPPRLTAHRASDMAVCNRRSARRPHAPGQWPARDVRMRRDVHVSTRQNR